MSMFIFTLKSVGGKTCKTRKLEKLLKTVEVSILNWIRLNGCRVVPYGVASEIWKTLRVANFRLIDRFVSTESQKSNFSTCKAFLRTQTGFGNNETKLI